VAGEKNDPEIKPHNSLNALFRFFFSLALFCW